MGDHESCGESISSSPFFGCLLMKHTVEIEVKQVKDLFSPLSVQQVRAILQKMGAQFEPVPNVELGNLSLQKVHMRMYIDTFKADRKPTEKHVIGEITMRGFNPDWTVDKNLIVQAVSPQESLRVYAQRIQQEFADYTNAQLKKYDRIGRKRMGRAKDEMLRRKLIDQVDERYVFYNPFIPPQ